jgi:peptidoglycan/LPS O-acetylase OafA/YrhL
MAVAATPPGKLGYRPGLDGLRALAVLTVIGFHYWHWPVGGNAGVELFFVLSGFLITTLLAEEWQQNGRILLGRFYLRRALRLLPALWAFLIVFGLVAHHSGQLNDANWVYGATYTMNIAWAVTGAEPAYLSHLWSLATEEQFYLLWPLILIVMLRARLRLAGILAAAGLLAGTVVVLRDVTIAGHLSYTSLAYFKFDAILIGCIAGLLFVYRRRALVWVCRGAVAYLAAAAVVFLLIRPRVPTVTVGSVAWYPYWMVFNLAAAVTIVWVVEGCPGLPPVRRLLALPPVAYTGRISYALYLWHPFVFDWLWWPHGGNLNPHGQLLRPLALAGTFAVASASYWLVERPFLRMKWRLSTTGSHDADASVILRHDFDSDASPTQPASGS